MRFWSPLLLALVCACSGSKDSMNSTAVPADAKQLQAQAKAWIDGDVKGEGELKTKGHKSIQGVWAIDVGRTLEANGGGPNGEDMPGHLRREEEQLRAFAEEDRVRITVDEFSIRLTVEGEEGSLSWLYRIEDVEPGRATIVMKLTEMTRPGSWKTKETSKVILTCSSYEECVGEWPTMQRLVFRRAEPK